MKKVLLVAVNGSYTHTNLAIRCLRKPLTLAGYDVVLKEYTLRDRNSHILREIVSEKADIIGFSCYIWNIDVMLSLSSDIKAVSSETFTIFGGPEVSFDTDRFEKLDYIDCIICGEGEEKIVEVCDYFTNNINVPKVVKGNLPANVMKEEGILYNDSDLENNLIPKGALLYYESSRGCPFSCGYCLSSRAEGLRCKSAEQTLADLKEFERFGNDSFKIIKFVDRTFNADRKRANEIWRGLLSPEFTKHYHFEICASLLDDEGLEILSEFPSGKIQLECGLQSTNPDTLFAVSRHIDSDKVIKMVKKVHDFGNIHIHLDLIAGLPYEGYERFRQSFNDAYFSCDLLQLGFLKLLHGTALRRDAEKYGIKFKKDAPYTVLKTDWISFDEMSKLYEIAETLERFRETGKFDNSVSFILSQGIKPFDFYEGLTDYIKTNDGRYIQQISQIDAYRLLYCFGTTVLQENLHAELGSMLHKDYELSETRVMPASLKKVID